MRPLGKLLPLEAAKALVTETIPQIQRKSRVALAASSERVLASEVVSPMDVPPFPRSSMDGYAVVAEDTFSAGKFEPVALELEGEIHAGEKSELSVSKGKCVQIATGAMMPQGADAVVMVENTEAIQGRILIFKPVHPGANVSKRGEDIRKGSLILRSGDFLTSGKVGVMAALGMAEVEVFDRPLVAIIPTGDEVAEVGEVLREGQVYDINSHTLASVLSQNGCQPLLHPIVKDDRGSLRKVLEASHADMIVLSGGSSAGERDLLESVVQELGEVIFHGVQIKPGKPTLFGMINGRPLFGMPGYPTACLTNGYIFLRPAARGMARLPPAVELKIQAPLGRKHAGDMGRHQFLTVQLRNGEAFPAFKESGAITSIALADGWIEIPSNVDLIEKGTMVEVHLF